MQMAAKFLNYEKHGVAESSAITSSQVGHLMNLKATVDTDNGGFSALDVTKFVEGDVWEAKIPAKTDPVLLILTSPLIYETYTKKCQEESNFYNAKNDVMRGYELKFLDKFALSKECFTNADAAAEEKYIAMDGTSFKATVYDTAPTDTAFVGYIYDVAPNGNYRVIVKKNA